MADSIIGWGSSVGKWARIDNKSVIGEDVHVKVLRPAANAPCSSGLAIAAHASHIEAVHG